jgi:hypothetical protein
VLANGPGPELVRAASVAARSHLIMAAPSVIDEQRIASRAAEIHQAEVQRQTEASTTVAIEQGVSRSQERQAERPGGREAMRADPSGSGSGGSRR